MTPQEKQPCCTKCYEYIDYPPTQICGDTHCPCHKSTEQPYNQTDHYHCWESKNPPCGQKIEHLKCCLCKLRNPKSGVELVPLKFEKGRLVEDPTKEAIYPTTDTSKSGCCFICKDTPHANGCDNCNCTDTNDWEKMGKEVVAEQREFNEVRKVFDLMIDFQDHIDWEKKTYDGSWLEKEINSLLERARELGYNTGYEEGANQIPL